MDGRPNRRNKAAFSNVSGVAQTRRKVTVFSPYSLNNPTQLWEVPSFHLSFKLTRAFTC